MPQYTAQRQTTQFNNQCPLHNREDYSAKDQHDKVKKDTLVTTT
jgi:hypothetical protein